MLHYIDILILSTQEEAETGLTPGARPPTGGMIGPGHQCPTGDAMRVALEVVVATGCWSAGHVPNGDIFPMTAQPK